MVRELIEPKRNVAAIVFSVLLMLALAVAVYLIFDILALNAQAEQLVTADYSEMRFLAQKGGQAQAAGVSFTEQLQESADSSVFITPMGFPIISYSQKWTDTKLENIYNELIRNKHGEEMRALSGVLIYPDKSPSGDEGLLIAGTHITHYTEYPVFFHLPGFVPSSLKYGIRARQSVIELYNMDSYDHVNEVARTIAHEYGHHYTMYYFLKNDEQARQSEYFRLRGLHDLGREVFFDNDEDYYANHMWSIYELAAEDYVQLMGSPNAKQTRDYMDAFDIINSGKRTYSVVANLSTYNVYPQENTYLPLADEVKGLRDYFLSVIGEESETEAFEPFDFNISMTRKSSYGHVHYEINWDKPTSDKNAFYTLVCYNTDGQVFLPVRTLKGNQ